MSGFKADEVWFLNVTTIYVSLLKNYKLAHIIWTLEFAASL